MKRRVFTFVFWFIGLVIGLGAFGHGFIGVIPVRTALNAAHIPPDVLEVIWIVWYFVSACMLLFSGLIIGAWMAARRGQVAALTIPAVIAVFYMAVGIASYAYQHNPFWLQFTIEGALLFIATWGLRSPSHAATRS